MRKLIFKYYAKILKKNGYIVISQEKLAEMESPPDKTLAAAVLEARKAKIESYLLLQRLENAEACQPEAVN